MMYKSEEEFLAAYNPEEFDRLSLTTDILILSISDEEVANYRKSSKYLRNITYKLIPSLEIGDEVFLGSYNNKVIKWTVLSIEDDNILLMSKGVTTSSVASAAVMFAA